jgi:hypothetical protein
MGVFGETVAVAIGCPDDVVPGVVAPAVAPPVFAPVLPALFVVVPHAASVRRAGVATASAERVATARTRLVMAVPPRAVCTSDRGQWAPGCALATWTNPCGTAVRCD